MPMPMSSGSDCGSPSCRANINTASLYLSHLSVYPTKVSSNTSSPSVTASSQYHVDSCGSFHASNGVICEAGKILRFPPRLFLLGGPCPRPRTLLTHPLIVIVVFSLSLPVPIFLLPSSTLSSASDASSLHVEPKSEPETPKTAKTSCSPAIPTFHLHPTTRASHCLVNPWYSSLDGIPRTGHSFAPSLFAHDHDGTPLMPVSLLRVRG
ncbi:hypothetical protein QBC45DRAFT_175885 [Copromyces sp. CBS 386.78]|nr:hypothetical protein QBC45DRAFT_175885 [Copromyces sp. CBS 386.78]